MTAQQIADAYLKHLQAGILTDILSLFADDGIVLSPLYGTLAAHEFYPKLAEDTRNSRLVFDGLFVEETKHRMALAFDYHWTLSDGTLTVFKVVDLIELDASDKIKKLTIIYDASEARRIKALL